MQYKSEYHYGIMRKMFQLLLAAVAAVILVIPTASATPERPGIAWENNWV
jgi:hypothetical protein